MTLPLSLERATDSVRWGQVWGMDANPDGTRLAVGYSSPVVELLRVVTHVEEEGEPPSSSGRDVLYSLGEVPRATADRAADIVFSPDGALVACLGAGKTVEIFR